MISTKTETDKNGKESTSAPKYFNESLKNIFYIRHRKIYFLLWNYKL